MWYCMINCMIMLFTLIIKTCLKKLVEKNGENWIIKEAMLRGYCCFSEGQFRAEVITKWLYPDTKCSCRVTKKISEPSSLYFPWQNTILRSKTVLDFLCNLGFICSLQIPSWITPIVYLTIFFCLFFSLLSSKFTWNNHFY